MSETLNLYQKLAKIRAISDVAKKDKRGYNYTYTDITQILANVTAGMKRYGVSLIPAIVPDTANIAKNVIESVKYSKTGERLETVATEMLFTTEMQFIWVNDEKPDDRIVVPWYATASMADASQSMGAALTYTVRQFLTAYFQIAQTDNDVDAYRSKQREAEEAENRTVATAIVDQVLEIINAHLEAHPDDREEIASIVKRYARDKAGKASGNPKNITSPDIAARLLQDINAHCGFDHTTTVEKEE